jgi:hypothetical protein
MYQPDPALDRVWASQDVQDMLGWATEPLARQVWVAVQPFELSQYMIWREDTHRITVLEGNGQWSVYDDTWVEGQPEQDPSIVAPAGKFQPKRGFGKLWRTAAGLRERLGWALEPEKGYTAAVQSFQYGAMIKTDDTFYVLGKSGDRTGWQKR